MMARRRTPLLALVLVLVSIVLGSSPQAGAVSVFSMNSAERSGQTSGTADMYVFNNTFATLTIDPSGFSHSDWNSRTVGPMGATSDTAMDVQHANDNSGNLDITISRSGQSHTFRIWAYTADRWTAFTLLNQDGSWTTSGTAQSGAPAIAPSGQEGTGVIEQMYNRDYVVSLFFSSDDDTGDRVERNAKIIVTVNPNPNVEAYKDGPTQTCIGTMMWVDGYACGY